MSAKDEKEDYMDKYEKPRLAEVLGVEVEERFRIRNIVTDDGKPVTFWINKRSGLLHSDPDSLVVKVCLIDAINRPERIIHIPRLTEAEIAICKAVGAKWVSKNKYDVRVTLWDEEPIFGDGMFFASKEDENAVPIGVIGRISDALFPSIYPGDCVCVEEANCGA